MSNQQLYSVMDASFKTGASTSSIRHWEKIGKVKSIRTAGGAMLFDGEGIETLKQLQAQTPRGKRGINLAKAE